MKEIKAFGGGWEGLEELLARGGERRKSWGDEYPGGSLQRKMEVWKFS